MFREIPEYSRFSRFPGLWTTCFYAPAATAPSTLLIKYLVWKEHSHGSDVSTTQTTYFLPMLNMSAAAETGARLPQSLKQHVANVEATCSTLLLGQSSSCHWPNIPRQMPPSASPARLETSPIQPTAQPAFLMSCCYHWLKICPISANQHRINKSPKCARTRRIH